MDSLAKHDDKFAIAPEGQFVKIVALSFQFNADYTILVFPEDLNQC